MAAITPPAGAQTIEVRVGELRQLFNAIDPSPFRERDLDPRAEAFIVEWGRDLPADAPLSLVVHLGSAAGRGDEAAMLAEAMHEYFGRRASETKHLLRELFRRGRISLAIGTAFLTLSLAIGDLVMAAFEGNRWAAIAGESLLIGGWVAMWRPLEIFLYDWWPIRADVRLYERLRVMPVRLRYEVEGTSGPEPG